MLAFLHAHSPYLADLAQREPDTLAAILSHGPDAVCDLALGTLTDVPPTLGRAQTAALLRAAKRRVALATAVADISGAWSLAQVTGALSDLAEGALRVATSHLLRATHDRGELRLRHPATPSRASGFTVLAMGKLGARELNFSSDVDLILVFDPEPHAYNADALSATFARLARDLVGLMQARDAGGYVFRTDLRLRPDPGSTPLAVSLPTALAYYEGAAHSWERAAMIKARPVAGDLALGRRFLDAIRPFVWRRHLDFAAIADIRAMKRRMDEARPSPPAGGTPAKRLLGRDLKLGQGGIREVEFCAQTLQLVWGGRNPALRCAATCDALAALAAAGHLPAETAATLAGAYALLRRTEHRLQMVHDRQTHSMPDTTAGLAAFAAFMAGCSARGGSLVAGPGDLPEPAAGLASPPDTRREAPESEPERVAGLTRRRGGACATVSASVGAQRQVMQGRLKTAPGEAAGSTPDRVAHGGTEGAQPGAAAAMSERTPAGEASKVPAGASEAASGCVASSRAEDADGGLQQTGTDSLPDLAVWEPHGFAVVLASRMDQVHAIFAGVLAQPAAVPDEAEPGPAMPGASEPVASEPAVPATPAAAACTAGAAAPVWQSWLAGRPRALRTERARDLLTELLPALTAVMQRQPNPPAAWARLDEFVYRLPAGVQIFSLLRHNPALLDRLGDVLGAAPSLADHLASVPAALEGLMAPQDVDPAPGRALAAQLHDARAPDEALAIASRFVRGEEFRLAAAELDGRIDQDQAGKARTALAEAAIRQILPLVLRDHVRRYGRLAGSGMVVVALGKAGSREMMAGSDLDLMLVYDHPDDVQESSGPVRQAPSQYFARAAQALVAALTVPTRDGKLYEVDMRLRPSGGKGPVAVSLAAFERYHRESAWTWERLALTRARVVAGPARLRARVAGAIATALAQGDPASVLPDTLAMRRRLLAEAPHPGAWDVKHRRGGLMEVEFIAQALQLRGAGAGAHSPVTRVALARLAQAGLLAQDDARKLIRADAMWRAIQGLLRITLGRAVPDAIPDATVIKLHRALDRVLGPARHADPQRCPAGRDQAAATALHAGPERPSTGRGQAPGDASHYGPGCGSARQGHAPVSGPEAAPARRPTRLPHPGRSDAALEHHPSERDTDARQDEELERFSASSSDPARSDAALAARVQPVADEVSAAFRRIMGET